MVEVVVVVVVVEVGMNGCGGGMSSGIVFSLVCSDASVADITVTNIGIGDFVATTLGGIILVGASVVVYFANSAALSM